MSRCIFHHVEDKEAAYKELLSSVLFVNEANWNELLEYFDTAYYGLLTHLKSTYPSLAQIDLLYVVMIVLGISTEDISILTNVTTQSVRNRKQQLKNRVAANLPIEEWLQIEVQACKEQMFAQ